MTKKIVWGLVVVGLVGILVAGAVVRTAAKAGDGTEAQGQFAQEGRGGQAREPGTGDGAGTGEAVVEEWLTFQGSVVSIDSDVMVVQLDSGDQIVVENRPWWFAQELGFAAQPGDRLTLRAFYEGDSIEVGQMANVRTGQAVQLREESGRPMWAGRGRRNG
jgi:hypothetical protein